MKPNTLNRIGFMYSVVVDEAEYIENRSEEIGGEGERRQEEEGRY